MTSVLEQASSDLKAARFVVHKLGKTFDSFQAHSRAISDLVDQWRSLRTSFGDVHTALESRVRDLEAKEREIGVVTDNLEDLRKEIEVKRENVECGEKSLREEVVKVESRRNEVRKWLAVVEVRKRAVSEREKAVEVKETELLEGLERVKKVDDEEARVRNYELEVDEWRRAVELEEIRVDKVAEELGSREEEVHERCKAVELREDRVDERFVEVMSKENELQEWKEVLEEREAMVNEGNRAMDSRERELDEIYSLLELRENEIDETEKGVKCEEKRLKLREDDVDLREMDIKTRCEELKAKEKDIVDRLDVLKVKEEDLRGGWRALVSKENGINERFDKQNREVNHKEMQVNAKCVVLEVKEGEMNDRWNMLELKGKEVDERGKTLELKQAEVEELRRGLEMKKKQMIEDLRHVELKQNQRYRELERKEKEISIRYKEMRKTKKKIKRRKKALDLRIEQYEKYRERLALWKKQFEDSSKELESKEHKVDVCLQISEQKESKLNDVSELVDELQEVPFEELLVVEESKVNQTKDGALNLELTRTSNHRLQRHKPASEEGQSGDKAAEARDAQIIEPQKEVDLKENQANDIDPQKEVDLKEKQANETARKGEVGQKQLRKCNGSETGASIFPATGGKTLQLYLNEKVYKEKLMDVKVVEMLKSAPNPAELALDAIVGFFSPHFSEDGAGVEKSIVRNSCLLFLELSMGMKPGLTKAVKKKATDVALEWRANMWVEGESEDVVLAFLLLLVTYNLTAVVNKDDLRRMYGIIEHHRLAPWLRQILGLLPKINGSSGIEDATEESIPSKSPQTTNALGSSSVRILGDIHSLCRNMDEHGVRSYLIDHVKEYGSSHDKILDALRNAPDPSKLVLSVCQTSVIDCDKNYADDTTCIILLIQLMKLAPSISQEVTNEASKFASFLKAKLKRSWNPVDHYRFLQFLVSYKLAHSYNPDELLSYFKVLYYGEEVYRPEENAYLCSALGLAKKIPGVIKSLIKQQALLSAVQYICVFKLELTFPLVPLLETHLQNAKNAADQKRKEGTFKGKIVAKSLESVTLKSILNCISNFKLESKFPPDHFFLARAIELEKEKESKASPRKRSRSPIIALQEQEKRSRVGTVQQCEPLSDVYSPANPLEPSSRTPRSFGTPFLTQPTFVSPPPWPPQSYGPNLHFSLHPPFMKQSAYFFPPRRPPQSYGPTLHLNPRGGGHSSMPPVHRDQGMPADWTAPNQWRF